MEDITQGNEGNKKAGDGFIQEYKKTNKEWNIDFKGDNDADRSQNNDKSHSGDNPVKQWLYGVKNQREDNILNNGDDNWLI
jgi:hypothetical protein